MGLKKLVKKAGKVLKKTIKTVAPVALMALAPAAAPLLAQGASPLGGLLGGGGGGAMPAGSFSPQSALSGLANTLLQSGLSKAECAILGTCGKGTAPVVASPAASAVRAESSSNVSPLVLLGAVVALFLILRK